MGLGTWALRPADWWPWVRVTYVAAPGLLAGSVAGMLLLVNSSPDEQPDPGAGTPTGRGWLQRVRSLPLPTRMAMSVGFGATVTAMQVGSLRADAGIEGWLSRRGVRHPRRWMAGTVVAMSLFSDLVEDHDDTSDVTPEPAREVS